MDIKKLLLLPIIFMMTTSFAQEQLKHEMKSYRDSEGRLYWNKNMPVFIHLSSTPEGKSEQLKSEVHAEYTEPYFFDTEGANYLRTRYAVDKETKKTIVPEVEVLWEVYADGRAPVSNIHFNTKNLYKTNDVLFIGKSGKITIKSSDKVAGVDNSYYSLDGKAYTKYSGELDISIEKEMGINYYSVDNVGNAEVTQTIRVSIDTTAPVTNYIVEGNKEGNILSRHAKVILDPSDKLSGVANTYYRIDGGSKARYGGKIYLSYLPEGDHSITYYSSDNVNNTESVKTFKFFVDRSAPVMVTELQGDMHKVNGKTYFSGRTKVKLTATDNKAGVNSMSYSVNGQEYQEYSEPFPVPTNFSSPVVRSIADDKVANKSRVGPGNNGLDGNALNIVPDLSGPNLSASYDGPIFETRDTIFISKNTKVKLKAVNYKSGLREIDYKINKGSKKDYDAPFTISKEGFYQIDFMGYDMVNNESKSDFYFYVDTTGPAPFERFSIEPLGKREVKGMQLDYYPKHTVLFLSATDAHVGFDKIYYSINGGKDKLYTGAIRDFRKGKAYTITMRAIDTLGNERLKSIKFAIEK